MSLLIRTPVLPIVGNEVLDVPEIKLIDGDNDIVRYIPLKDRNSVTHRIQHPLIKKIESRVSSELVEVEKTPSTLQSALDELKALIGSEDKKRAAARYISQVIRQHREAEAAEAAQAPIPPASQKIPLNAKAPIPLKAEAPIPLKATAADAHSAQAPETQKTPNFTEDLEAKKEAARVVRYHIYLAREAEREAERQADLDATSELDEGESKDVVLEPTSELEVEEEELTTESFDPVVPLQMTGHGNVIELNQSFDWGEIQWLRDSPSDDLGESQSQLIRPKIEQNHDQLKDESTVTQSVIPVPELQMTEPVLAQTQRRNTTLMKRLRNSLGRLVRNLFTSKSQKKFMEDKPLYTKEYVIPVRSTKIIIKLPKLLDS